MGRKSRNKKAAQSHGASSSGDAPKQLSKAVKKELSELVKTLLDKCSQQGSAGSKDFEDYLEIRDLVEKIRDLQKDVSLGTGSRNGNSFATFMEWLKSNKVDTEAVEIEQFADYGYGLKAAKDVKGEEKILAIPRALMMTPQTAQQSQLGPLMSEDKILQVMPSVVLALHLLCERRAEESRWRPYLDILPDTYTTPLYFTPDHLKMLKGSPALTDCINQYRNIARQYAYFYRLLLAETASTNQLPIKDCFTYDDYRWAVSTVMTRQNQIPLADGGKMTFALIPLWDMCNHCNGLITTDFNLDQDCCECFSLRSYCKGDQIFIFYGARSNAELLVNNGFVYKENEHDRMAVKLGISKSDSQYSLKSDMLTKCGLLPARTFYLHTGDLPVDGDLLAFLRVFSMDEESLKGRLSGLGSEELREELGDLDRAVSTDNELKVWGYLETRASLLLKAYETTAQEDEELLKEGKLSDAESACVLLRCCEKQILQSTAAYCGQRKQKLQPGDT